MLSRLGHQTYVSPWKRGACLLSRKTLAAALMLNEQPVVTHAHASCPAQATVLCAYWQWVAVLSLLLTAAVAAPKQKQLR